MEMRGWGWSASQIRQAGLAEWLAEQPADGFCSVTEFYAGLEDQAMNTWDVAYGDLKLFESQSLINLSAAMGGIPGLHVSPRLGVRDMAQELREKRANKGLRTAQCRDAMVDWLHSLGAVSATPDMPVTKAMLDDPRHGIWFAESFAAGDLDAAAAWLQRKGLVAGISVEEAEGPARLHLTDAGIECAEEYDSDTGRYVQGRQQQRDGGQVVNFLGSATGVQVARDYARQQQQVGASADQLRTMITGIAELVAALVPGTADVAEQRDTALAAAQDGAVDVGAVRRFYNWVVTALRKCGNAAAVEMVAIQADEMIREALRLAGHA
jgi:hypothetical protein